MKAFFVIFCFCVTISANAKSSLNDPHKSYSDTLIFFLQQLNLNNYYNKPVDSLLAVIPATPDSMRVYSNVDSRTRLFFASELTVWYPDGIFLRIFVTQFNFMNPYSSSLSWDSILFRKENIFKVSIYKDSFTCINGWCQ